MYPVLHAALGKSILKRNLDRSPHIPASGAWRLAAAVAFSVAIAAAGDRLVVIDAPAADTTLQLSVR